MATAVIMPMLGLTMEEGAVVEWLKREGEEVRKDEPLFTVEMDKGIVEVPAPASGVLLRVGVAVGQVVPVKTVIAEIGAAGERLADVPPATAPAGLLHAPAGPADAARPQSGGAAGTASRPFASPRARMRARERGINVVDVPGTGPNGRVVEDDVLAYVAAQAPSAGRVPATPIARRLAAEHGLRLEAITGTGPGGRVTQEDVLAMAGSRDPGPAASGATPPARPIQQVDEELLPLSRIRRVTAERMASSARTAARVTLQLEADLTEAARFRGQLAPEFQRLGVPKLPWDAVLAKAAGLALLEHPAVNAQWVEGQGIRRQGAAHVGVAVALEPEGLLVPVLRDAGPRSLRELAGELNALVDRARAGRLAPGEMQGGTFTITNLGAYRIDAFTPIVNPPETAILGVGRIAEKPVVIEHRIEVRQMCTLSLSFDHRVVDGVPAAAFLRRLAELLERPYALLEI